MPLPNCPQCGAEIPASAINISQGAALCPACGKLIALRNLVGAAGKSTAQVLDSPPDGCFVWRQAGAREVAYTLEASFYLKKAFLIALGCCLFFLLIACMVSSNALASLWLMLRWGNAGFSSGWFSTIFELLFLIPFLVAVVLNLFIPWLFLKSRLQVEIAGSRGEIRWGLEQWSWKKSFNPEKIEQVNLEPSSHKQNEVPLEAIMLRGEKKIELGAHLTQARRDWLLHALRTMLLQDADSQIQQSLLAQAQVKKQK